MENDKSCRYILALDNFMKSLKDALTNHIAYNTSCISAYEFERFRNFASDVCDMLFNKFTTTCKEYDTTWTRYELFNIFSKKAIEAISTCICKYIAFDEAEPRVVSLHLFYDNSPKYIIKLCDIQPMISVMCIEAGAWYRDAYVLTQYDISKWITVAIGGDYNSTHMQLISMKKVTL